MSRGSKYVFDTVSFNIYSVEGLTNTEVLNMKSEILKCNSYLIYGLFMIITIVAHYGPPPLQTTTSIFLFVKD